MKKTLTAIGVAFGLAIFAQLMGVSFAAPYPTGLGGTGTSQTPVNGNIPIGNGAGSYTPALITPGTDIIITNGSGSVTLAVKSSDFLASSTVYVASVNGQTGAVVITSSTLGAATNTLSLFNGNGFTTTTIQAVLNALSATGLASYSSSTGILNVSSSSLNLRSASQYNFSDFLPSSTVYVATVNGQSGAVTVSVPATTTINGTQATVFKLIGDGTTVTSTANGTTTTFSIVNTGNWAGTWQGVNSSTFYLASNPNGYTNNTGTVFLINAGHGISLSPASITASGTISVNTSTVIADVVASGQLLPSSTVSGTTNFLPIWTSVNTLGSSIVSQSGTAALMVGGTLQVTSTGQSNIANIDNTLFADQFPGSDIGSSTDAAYLALPNPSNNQGGGNIYINASSSYSIPIVLGTGAKFGNLIVPDGTQLKYTGAGAAYTDNSGGTFFHTAHTLQGIGIFGTTFPAANATTTGIYCGGSNGCIGLDVNGVTVVGLGYGYYLGNNAYMNQITNSIFRNDNQAFVATSSNNSGENIYVGQSQFVDCGNNTTTKCVYFSPFAADTMLAADSFDDAQQYFDNGNYDILETKIHSENSNVSAYHSYVQTVLTTSTDLTDVSGDYNNDASTAANDPAAFIQNKGGNLLSIGTVFQANGGDTISDATTGTGCAIYLGDRNVNSAATNLYGSAGWPAFDDKNGCGNTNLSTTTAPALTVNGNVTTTSETVTGILQDGSGNKYVTSTVSSVATTTINGVSGPSFTFVAGTSTAISNNGSTFTFSNTTLIPYIVAGYNAPTSTQAIAYAVCTGTADDTCINNVINAVASSSVQGGTISLIGTFHALHKIYNDNPDITISGTGISSTVIYSSSTDYGIQLGNREIQGDPMLANMGLQNLTLYMANGSGTYGVYVDGMGLGGFVNYISANGAAYDFVLEDLDRDSINNDYAGNPTVAGFEPLVGAENTWGNINFSNDVVALSVNNTTGWVWNYDPVYQTGTPQAFDRVLMINPHIFNNTNLPTTTGMVFNNCATSYTETGGLYENNAYHFIFNGTSSQACNITSIGESFLNNTTNTVDAFQFNNLNHSLTVIDDRFQEILNVFHDVSGFSSVSVEGINSNQGNITNIWTGSFALRTGTDVNFAGPGTLVSGLSTAPYAVGYFTAVSSTNVSASGTLQVAGLSSLASTTVTGNVTTTHLSVTGITNALGLLSSTGAVTAFGGSTCSSGLASQISATGTLICTATSTSGSATTTINGAAAQFNFTSSTASNAFTISTSTVGGSSTIKFTIPSNLGFFTNDSGYITSNTTSTWAKFFTSTIQPTISNNTITLNTADMTGISIPVPTCFDAIGYGINTSDTTLTDHYDIGVYQTSGTIQSLLADIGAQSMPTSGIFVASTTQGLQCIPAGIYQSSWTGNSTTAKFDAGNSIFYPNNFALQSASTGGQLPATSTSPTINWSAGGNPLSIFLIDR